HPAFSWLPARTDLMIRTPPRGLAYLPAHILPVRLAELSLEDLVCAALRQLAFHKLDPARDLVSGDAAPAVIDQIVVIERGAVLQHHASHHQLAPRRIGNSDDGGLFHARVRVDGGFHLAGVHVFAARYDHVLAAVHVVHEAVFVLIRDITGAEPSHNFAG